MTATHNFRSLDLSEDSNVNLIRQTGLREAIKGADFREIEKILRHIIDKRPDRIQEKIDLVDHALTHSHVDKAAEYLRQIHIDMSKPNEDVPRSVYANLLRINLRLNNNDIAARIARIFLPDFNRNARLAIMSMRAFDRAGDQQSFIIAAEAAAGFCEDDYERLAEITYLLNNRSLSRKVIEILRGVDLEAAGNFDLAFQYSRALSVIDPTGQDTIKVANLAHEMGGKPLKSAILLSKLYLGISKPRQALAVIEMDNIATSAQSTRAQYADALMANGRYQEAAELYQRLVHDNPTHSGWRRACVSALLLGGDEGAAKSLYQDDLKARNLSHFSCFDEALDAINLNLDQAGIPDYRFDWAYKKLEMLGCAPERRNIWEDQCRWINLADHLTLNWLEARPQDADQILPLIHGADQARDLLLQSTKSGTGAFIAAAHVGALFAGPFALAKSGLEYRWVASTPMVSGLPGSEFLLSTFSKNKLHLAKKIFGAVKKGAVVSIAIDGNSGIESRSVPFLNETIRLSDFIPRAVFQTGASSFFPKVLWKDGLVSIELVQLIDPAPTDTLDDFISVWFDSFIKQLTGFFKEFPTNLRMTGGLWDEVTQ